MKASKLLLATSIIVPLMAGSTLANASDVSLRISNDSVHTQVNLSPNNSNIDLGAGYMYHEGSRHIINLDLHAKGQTAIGNLPTTAGIGVQATGYDDKRIDGGALGLGGFARLNIPSVPGLAFEGALHYAPSILSFGDSDDLTRVRAQVNYRVIQNADVFLGYHYLNTDLDGGSDVTLDKGIFAGMKLLF
ncbi:YfaZ family outer membrane protein [Alkalimarinus sediminis]|uniref:YfaZ family protein n=1 Tax=Alkalimarinus sediminis TaxID=1632866 RepID=A0A9E8HFG0_9ALTE|nr:YfaZ family outer membrane protein [Alkalimarinus sediminis]UZW73464.1 YfaZ family protein [Alkalimarinus sediminis]